MGFTFWQWFLMLGGLIGTAGIICWVIEQGEKRRDRAMVEATARSYLYHADRSAE